METTEQEIIDWVDKAQQNPMGRSMVPLSRFTARFGLLEGDLLALVLQMSRDYKIDLQVWDNWLQKEAAGEFVDGRDFIHINQYRRGLGFINVSRN